MGCPGMNNRDSVERKNGTQDRAIMPKGGLNAGYQQPEGTRARGLVADRTGLFLYRGGVSSAQ